MMPPPGHDANLDRAFAQAMKEKRYDATLSELGESEARWADRVALTHCLLANGRLDLLYQMLDVQKGMLASSELGGNLLSSTLYYRNENLIRYLTTAGVRLHAEVLFSIAPYGMDKHFLRFLREQGADPTHLNRQEDSLLHIHARYNGRSELVPILIGYGVPLERHNVMGHTALQAACQSWNAPYAKALLFAGADKNVITENGATLLHLACYGIATDDINRPRQHFRTELVELLLAEGLDPSVPNHDGKTPLDFARHFGHTNLVALFSSQPVK
ncbi:ankyrin repeat domain-containing protein [Armatimonas sp.]|uniref:ankyrin repeat domain-containing protein n=1 Tax=Armatimonas sp. TaxID=1872638 RepID=UPI00286C46D9|nr:ankyrin repeat domain-containing protein [Armatimonas sp.]